MKKVRTLVLAAVMVVGLSAASATVVNAGCAGYSISCGSYTEAGIICSSGFHAHMVALARIASEVC